ncbi:unc-50 related protein homolog [Trypanosoma equiperdum]|uniref:Unc-50 related protein homolog n=2 Tax=Trypanozoon TaxID=39700 RepID=Q38DR2_TRYB2|nr:hypothetical protein, conserved [Trypanosoma brucei brucei TREU927]EAN77058.1 hypothetical protein, conserved [Trypanosoma brucei brucei TREU927]SCU68914.1 unc-50 related protein homolog [Trypanosoma equiperdum]
MAQGGFTLSSRWVSRLPEFARRAFQYDQMELDSALAQMYSLCVKPSLISKMSKARKMTKNHYHRDDPAFIVLQIFSLVLTVAAYGLALRGGLLQILYNTLYSVLLGYFAAGGAIATVTWLFANHFLAASSQPHESGWEVDWRYSFDVHCNGYFPYFIWTKVIQFVLLPIVLHNSCVPRAIGNCLHTVGLVMYAYVVFLGYLELPMLAQQQRLMYPVPLVVVFMLLVTLFTSWNVSYWSLCQTWCS